MNDLDNYNIENNNLDDNLNNNKLDIKGSWSKGHYAKTNSNKTSDIYERFINRVQSINSSDEKTGESDKTSTGENIKPFESSLYEPLSDQELQFIISPRQTLDTQETNTITSNDEDNAIELSLEDNTTFDDVTLVSAIESNIDSDNKQIGVLRGILKGRQVSSLKLLIIGIVCGLVFSILIVILLNATGIFAALSDKLASKNPQTTAISTSVPVVSTEPSANEETIAKADDVSLVNPSVEGLNLDNPTATVAAAKSIDETVNVESESINDPRQDTSSKAVSKNSIFKKDAEIKADNVGIDNVRSETMISYEDFAEEAQNTLYREATN